MILSERLRYAKPFVVSISVAKTGMVSGCRTIVLKTGIFSMWRVGLVMYRVTSPGVSPCTSTSNPMAPAGKEILLLEALQVMSLEEIPSGCLAIF